MNARDDLVAEAIAVLREQAAGYKDSPGGMRTRILGTELSQEHAKALLAMLDEQKDHTEQHAVVRRILNRGHALAMDRANGEFVDLFQHALDEFARLPAPPEEA